MMITMSGRVLNRPPVISFLLIVEMANAGDVWCMAVLLRPVDCFSLCFERRECVFGVVFDHIIVDVGTVGAALGSGLNINYRHALFLQGSFVSEAGNYAQIKKVDVDFWHLADGTTVFRHVRRRTGFITTNDGSVGKQGAPRRIAGNT
jgi:hypothetical protein